MSGQNEQQQPGPDAELARKMSQPIDAKATYTIHGQDVVALMGLIDEVPMKYARQLLPGLLGSLERQED